MIITNQTQAHKFKINDIYLNEEILSIILEFKNVAKIYVQNS